jgi:tetratricopeptide (TPR) repeat protein
MRPDLVLAMGEGGSNLASLVGENDARFTIYAHQAHPKKSIPSDYLLPAGPVMRVGLAPPVIDRKAIESHRRILAPLEADSAALANSHYRANLGVIDLTSAAMFARAGFPEDAVLEARKARSLDPQSPAPYLMLAEVRERQGIAEEASTLYRAALEREPGNDAAMVRLGALTEKAGDSGEARALYERAIGVNERSGPAHAMLGLLLFRSGGDNEKALFHLERALALGAGSDDVQRAIGELQSMREVK